MSALRSVLARLGGEITRKDQDKITRRKKILTMAFLDAVSRWSLVKNAAEASAVQPADIQTQF